MTSPLTNTPLHRLALSVRPWRTTEFDHDVIKKDRPLPVMNNWLKGYRCDSDAVRGDGRGRNFWWPDIKFNLGPSLRHLGGGQFFINRIFEEVRKLQGRDIPEEAPWLCCLLLGFVDSDEKQFPKPHERGGWLTEMQILWSWKGYELAPDHLGRYVPVNPRLGGMREIPKRSCR